MAAPAGNPGYHGNTPQVPPMPDNKNCCLWIEGLPPQVTEREFLSKIRGAGKIWNFSIARPKEGHTTSAAKLTFWKETDVERFLDLVKTTFKFGNYVLDINHNKFQTAAQEVSDKSRVIHIAGPGAVVNGPTLDRLFRANFYRGDDAVITHATDANSGWIEWRFASHIGQASRAWDILQAGRRGSLVLGTVGNEGELLRHVVTIWGADPCDEDYEAAQKRVADKMANSNTWTFGQL
ncbi:hypothetical protein GGR53DRAFT_525010 [Hypoxylon sp. FL1150]|nr:hypothetical protein GGR53DRAFT_525010 [Hypoxylon sp. FL1150]